MSASTSLAKIIRVAIVRDQKGVFVATSPTLKGLIVASKDLHKLVNRLIPDAIARLYRECSQEVLVAQADDEAISLDASGPDLREGRWVAFPASTARQSLESAA